jgi:hypothetical protein
MRSRASDHTQPRTVLVDSPSVSSIYHSHARAWNTFVYSGEIHELRMFSGRSIAGERTQLLDSARMSRRGG